MKDNFRIRSIVVDDEPFALKLMADDLSKIPFVDLKQTFSSPLDGLAFIRKEPIDLIFLDIQMPVLKGTELLRSLPHPPYVIFTTAFEQYALEGFELHAADYLMKPVPFDRLLKAVNRVHEQLALRRSGRPSSLSSEPDSFFFVHSDYKEIKIFHKDIVYVEGLKDYVKIFLESQPKPVLTRLNLKAMEAKLPSAHFARIHNSYIVSLSKISSTQKLHVFLGQKIIPIGDRYAERFRHKYRHGSMQV